MLDPKPTTEQIMKILVHFNYGSAVVLAKKINSSHTSINKVLAGANLPRVRKWIIWAMGLSFDPWATMPGDPIIQENQDKSMQKKLEGVAHE